MLTFLIILSTIFGIITLISFILLRRNVNKEEKYIDVIDELQKSNDNLYEFIEKLSETLAIGKTYLENLDEKGFFNSDDEIGYYFEQMKSVQKDLNAFIIDNNLIDGEKKKEDQETVL